MSNSGIQGEILEVSVVGCYKLKDTEWISKQDPYVCLEYGGTKFRTSTCKDGHRDPTFQQKFVFTLIEGLRELSVAVWNNNTITQDDFIGSGKVHLSRVLSQGYDDSTWPLQTKTGRHAGEVRLILHYSNVNKHTSSVAPSAPPYIAPPRHEVLMYSAPCPGHGSTYPSPATAYPPSPYPSFQHSAHAPFPPPPQLAGHYQQHTPPLSAYPPPAYPPPAYPAPPSAYPPPSASPYYPQGQGAYPGIYPPPPH